MKPIAATVTALEDCTMAVTSAPEPSACQRVRVAPARMRCSAGPAASLRPSLIMPMPSRNRPSPPASGPINDKAPSPIGRPAMSSCASVAGEPQPQPQAG